MLDLGLIFVLLALLGFCVFATWTLHGLWRTKVPFVPSDQAVIQTMIDFAHVQPDDQVYELGCGDGRILFRLADHLEKLGKNLPIRPLCADFRHLQIEGPKDIGGNMIGYELIAPLVWYARLKNVLKSGNLEFRAENFFTADLSGANVIFVYLLPEIMQKFSAEIWPQLAIGTRVISHSFSIPDLNPTKQTTVGNHTVFVYQKKS